MSIGRVVGGVASTVAVLGCAAVVLGMANAGTPTADRQRSATPTAERSSRPAHLPFSAAPTTPTTPATTAPTKTRVTATASSRTTAGPAPSPSVRSVMARTSAPPATTTAAPAPRTTSKAAAVRPPVAHTAPSGRRLPLGYGTGSASRVVTVTASSHGSTYATLQAWTKVSTGRWKKYGSSVTARVGADGIGRASESRSKTPSGSYTITGAFGRNSDPGTRLPYFRTTPADYWMSSPGSKYNTHQRCSACGYDNGINERLAEITPEYNLAVVIDYNTRNAPGGVKPGAGSAFFLHVSGGEPTAGCVSIPQDRLATVMRWLDPDKAPRILLGTD